MTPVSHYQDYLPHRGPMVWIDYVLESDADGGVCLVRVDPEKHYCSETEVRQSALIEWMAQAYGFLSAQFYSASEQKLEKAFLVGVDRMNFPSERPQFGEELLIQIKKIRVVGPISYVEGKVLSKQTQVVYAEATLKLFAA